VAAILVAGGQPGIFLAALVAAIAMGLRGRDRNDSDPDYCLHAVYDDHNRCPDGARVHNTLLWA